MHDINIKLKSYKFELLGEFIILHCIKKSWVRVTFLQFESSFVDLKIHEGFYLVCHVQL